MSCSQKTYEAHQYAKQHYQRLLSARSCIGKLKRASGDRSYSCNRTLTPLDRFEYQLTNDKLCHKLVEIYKEPPRRPKRPKKKNKKTTIAGEEAAVHASLTRPDSIHCQNVRMFERLLETKSTVGEDWKKRRQKLKGYSKLTRKTSHEPHPEYMFDAYQELVMEGRKEKGRRRYISRPASSQARTQRASARQTL